MKSKKSRLDTLPEIYKKKFKRINSETYKRLFYSREKALVQARKTIEELEPENLNEEHIVKVADGMQALARIVLEERGILTKD